MQTITFYSYKGGVGRTLAVANVARYLARFGQKVFLVDFDLEAPGLHYKLALGEKNHPKQIELGVLDYIYSFAIEGKIPDSLEPYVIPVDLSSSFNGLINLMPAGKIPCTDYWRRLARINWHELFYSDQPQGIPFFLEFKERIERDYAPDFLLVDSRTGVTEIGGVATSLWPDRLVCLLLNNRENLEGARAVLRSIQSLERLPGQGSIEILPVLTRIPKMEEPTIEERIIKEIQDFLNEEAEELTQTLNVQEVFILHSEPELQIQESISIGGEKSLEESPLLRDYLRLCARLIPSTAIEPYIDLLIKEIIASAMQDPDGAQRDLETLVATCAHPKTYRALLQFYRLRSISKDILLRTAWQYWYLYPENSETLIWEVAKESLEAISEYGSKKSIVPVDFIESVWQFLGASHIKIGFHLAHIYVSKNEMEKAIEIFDMLLEKSPSNAELLVRIINFLNSIDRYKEALTLIRKYKFEFRNDYGFQIAWANSALKLGKSQEVMEILEDSDFEFDKLRDHEPTLWVKLMTFLTASPRGLISSIEVNPKLRASVIQYLSTQQKADTNKDK